MPHSVTLITTIAAALGLALIMGFVAARLKLPPLVGYLIAGIIIGPATPGFVADVELSHQLAEIGVMLLMFGVGLHFSLDELLAVRRIALPGAIVQIAVATLLGTAVAAMWGWSLAGSIVFGLASFGREHSCASQGAGKSRHAGNCQRPHRRRLARGRGLGDGPGAGAAAAACGMARG